MDHRSFLIAVTLGFLLVPNGVAFCAAPVDFQRDVAPILVRRCLNCHNHGDRRGGLSLQSAAMAAAGGESGKVIEPADAASSYLLDLLIPTDGVAEMPQDEVPLAATEIDILRQWIAQGAVWPSDVVLKPPLLWSLKPIVRPAIPNLDVATDRFPIRNPIDAFIAVRHREAGLKASPPADRRTLIRRLYLDITGLLPLPAAVDSFVADSEPKAYQRVVDGLLNSPHYGEQWGRHWLDLARYADSDGYLGDDLRPWAWVYRDWVIEAINRDQPFDQFSIEQLAGDLLPSASQSQKIATGFHRNNLKNTEAGADRELNRTKQVVDRVATTGSVWLGLSVGCAECHDHKHDPISQKEFYQLYAFFNNTNDADISVRLENEWHDYEQRKERWEDVLAKLEKPLAVYQSQKSGTGSISRTELAAVSSGEPGLTPKRLIPKSEETTHWTLLRPDKVTAAGTDLEIQKDGSVRASGKVPSTVSYFVETPIAVATTITGFRLEALAEFGVGREMGKTVGRGTDGEFAVSIFITDLIEDGKAKRLPIQSAKSDHFDGLKAAKSLDYQVTEGWRVSTLTYQPHTAVFQLAEPAKIPAGSRIKFSIGQKHGTGNSLRHFRLSVTSETGPFEPSVPLMDPEFARLRLPMEKHLANEPTPPKTKAQTFTQRGTSDRRESFVHIRGNYAAEGEPVMPATPASLHPLRVTENPNRLALAHWLFDERNPITARVAANRIWQRLLGVGIVATSDDFGTHGTRPTHPLLLDWLATQYRDLGWSRKELIRTIVMSSTYRQSSVNSNPELPNERLWRQNSLRVSAESVRDVHLVASGLLEPKIGGPGIRPALPKFVTSVGRSVQWPLSEKPDRYRRGIYILLKRTVLYPMLTTFDAPDTSLSCSRREHTDTPMQALTLLNDPVFFECAETLGRELHATHGDDIDGAIRDLVRRCLNRELASGELETLKTAHRDFMELAEGSELSEDPGLAMIATARVVMNLNEFVTRD